MGIQSDIELIKRTLARIESQAGSKPTKKAKSKSKLNEKQSRQRTARILKNVGEGRSVSVEQLGNIAQKHGMVRTATGTFYASGYLKKDKREKITLTKKGRAFKI